MSSGSLWRLVVTRASRCRMAVSERPRILQRYIQWRKPVKDDVTWFNASSVDLFLHNDFDKQPEFIARHFR